MFSILNYWFRRNSNKASKISNRYVVSKTRRKGFTAFPYVSDEDEIEDTTEDNNESQQ